MLNLKAFRTLQSEDEYNAALKEVRPYFEMAGCVGLFTSPQSSSEEEILTALFNDLRGLLG